jgi:hypothetical protein
MRKGRPQGRHFLSCAGPADLFVFSNVANHDLTVAAIEWRPFGPAQGDLLDSLFLHQVSLLTFNLQIISR